eukprot:3407438-Amphidinium_carterae.1
MQYLNGTTAVGLIFPWPDPALKHQMVTYSDSSCAPSGAHSQTGIVTYMKYRHQCHITKIPPLG